MRNPGNDRSRTKAVELLVWFFGITIVERGRRGLEYSHRDEEKN